MKPKTLHKKIWELNAGRPTRRESKFDQWESNPIDRARPVDEDPASRGDLPRTHEHHSVLLCSDLSVPLIAAQLADRSLADDTERRCFAIVVLDVNRRHRQALLLELQPG